MFITELFTIVKTWKQPKCTNEWISKLWYIHKREFFSALKRKKILQYATTWMYLEDIMLRKISQSLCDSTYMRYLTVLKIIQTKYNDGCQGLGEKIVFKGFRVSVLQDGQMVVLVAQKCECI